MSYNIVGIISWNNVLFEYKVVLVIFNLFIYNNNTNSKIFTKLNAIIIYVAIIISSIITTIIATLAFIIS